MKMTRPIISGANEHILPPLPKMLLSNPVFYEAWKARLASQGFSHKANLKSASISLK